MGCQVYMKEYHINIFSGKNQQKKNKLLHFVNKHSAEPSKIGHLKCK